jgi:hypothetical protein
MFGVSDCRLTVSVRVQVKASKIRLELGAGPCTNGPSTPARSMLFTPRRVRLAGQRAWMMTSWREASRTSAPGSSDETCSVRFAVHGRTAVGRDGGERIHPFTLPFSCSHTICANPWRCRAVPRFISSRTVFIVLSNRLVRQPAGKMFGLAGEFLRFANILWRSSSTRCISRTARNF